MSTLKRGHDDDDDDDDDDDHMAACSWLRGESI